MFDIEIALDSLQKIKAMLDLIIERSGTIGSGIFVPPKRTVFVQVFGDTLESVSEVTCSRFLFV